MLLLVDVGNTNITVATARAGALGPVRRATTPRASTPDELEVLLDGLLRLDGGAIEAIDRIVAASVVPSVAAALEVMAGRRALALLAASVETVPIAVRVDRPAEVGPDRLVNAFAAVRLHGAPAIVVDFGTATTFDVVAPDGAYVGGAIAPGLELGLEALAARTARLPRVELREPAAVIGRDTTTAMQAGTVFGYQALAAGLLARTRAELASGTGADVASITAILTGGLSAAPWARGIEGVDAIDPDLTLRGLLLLADEAGS
ncbi:MAG: type III pantothenate kinase [Chloroflexi bacterium]|jgi:type III pantothenate kinase|nr:type III pantothenate kinase [Chloroflexota bacterium]